MNYRTRTIHSTDVDDVEVELQFQPCDWMDMHKVKVGNKLVVAYNVLDDDHRSIDDLMGDCMGRIVDAYNGRDTSELYELAGYDRYGDKDLDAVWDKHEDEAIERYIKRLMANYSVIELREGIDDEEVVEAPEIEDWLRQDARGADWANVAYEKDMEAVLEDMWDEPAYWPGNPDAVFLDVYDHSGQVWSLSGGGTRCRWDTSSGAGAWIPDKYLLQEIDANQGWWCYYQVRDVHPLRRGERYQLVEVVWTQKDGATWALDKEHVEFSDGYGSLWKKAKDLAGTKPSPLPNQVEWGRASLCRLYAQQFLDSYNEIISGNIYGCTVEVFDLDGEQVEEESCWGFIGSDYTKESLKAEFFDPMVLKLTKEWEDTREQA